MTPSVLVPASCTIVPNKERQSEIQFAFFGKEIIKIRSRQHEHKSQCDGPAWLTSERATTGAGSNTVPLIGVEETPHAEVAAGAATAFKMSISDSQGNDCGSAIRNRFLEIPHNAKRKTKEVFLI
jgi:hypothetical protein